MQKRIQTSQRRVPAEQLGIRSLLSFLESRASSSGPLVGDLLRISIGRIKELAWPDFDNPVKSAKHYDALFSYTNQVLSLIFHGNQPHISLLALPVSAQLIALQSNVETDYCPLDDFCVHLFNRSLPNHLEAERHFYIALWKKYMHIPYPFQEAFVLPVRRAADGERRFYQVRIDFQFVEIKSRISQERCHRVFADIDFGIQSEQDMLRLLASELPLSEFVFEGFRRIEGKDITQTHLSSLLEDRIVNAEETRQQEQELETQIKRTMHELSDRSDLVFNLIPKLTVNEKFTFDDPRLSVSNTVSEPGAAPLRAHLYAFLSEIYVRSPKRIYLETISDDYARQYQYLSHLRSKGVISYALLPVFYHQELVGVVEVYTEGTESLSKASVLRIETLMSVLGLFFRRSVERFKQSIERIIWDHFTSIQSTVKWKFSEAAWQFIRQSNQTGTGQMDRVGFENVYPLYGAVDIRNSSVNRSAALSKDLAKNLQLAIQALKSLLSKTKFTLLDEKIFLCEKWLARLRTEPDKVLLPDLEGFINDELNGFLTSYQNINFSAATDLEPYFAALDTENGEATVHRRNLEQSMNLIIGIITAHTEQMRLSCQSDFPCFFEKFRTDGVEYDIYIGQSLSKEKVFHRFYIQNMRLLQLTNMISIVNEVARAQPSLPTPIETTQLIFLHPDFIDIFFRTDERRFDVEGAYNIRYQIVKKRIDKVLIRNSSERLTMPGKIAIVYFSQRDADELTEHIQFLQERNLLMDDFETLELEPLQGVAGLKALRVGVVLERK
jgi:hypothetical protein